MYYLLLCLLYLKYLGNINSLKSLICLKGKETKIAIKLDIDIILKEKENIAFSILYLTYSYILIKKYIIL
jgi:hypothetical protein